MKSDEREQSTLVKLRVRGEQYQVVNLHTRKILYRCYFENDAEQWCTDNGRCIMERP